MSGDPTSSRGISPGRWPTGRPVPRGPTDTFVLCRAATRPRIIHSVAKPPAVDESIGCRRGSRERFCIRLSSARGYWPLSAATANQQRLLLDVTSAGIVSDDRGRRLRTNSQRPPRWDRRSILFFGRLDASQGERPYDTPSRTAILAEVDSLLHKPTLSREDSARAEQLLNLADSLVDRTELRRAIFTSGISNSAGSHPPDQRRREISRLSVDRARRPEHG